VTAAMTAILAKPRPLCEQHARDFLLQCPEWHRLALRLSPPTDGIAGERQDKEREREREGETVTETERECPEWHRLALRLSLPTDGIAGERR